jgi:uncharacterized membrane protein YfcA
MTLPKLKPVSISTWKNINSVVWYELERSMSPEWFIFLACLALGAVIGLLAGMLGIGGGLIAVPVLTYLLSHVLDISPFEAITIAIATSLATIILTGLSSSRAHFKLGNLQRDIILYCGIGIALGATLGAQTASVLDGRVLKGTFAVLVILVALQMMFGKKKASDTTYTPVILLVVGLFTGFVSALMGIGGGAILVPALVLFNVDIHKAIGCAAFSGLVIAVFGTANFVYTGWSVPTLPEYALGYVYLPAAMGIVVTSVLTAPVGAKYGQTLDTVKLKRIFAMLLVLVSVRMLLDL